MRAKPELALRLQLDSCNVKIRAEANGDFLRSCNDTSEARVDRVYWLLDVNRGGLLYLQRITVLVLYEAFLDVASE